LWTDTQGSVGVEQGLSHNCSVGVGLSGNWNSACRDSTSSIGSNSKGEDGLNSNEKWHNGPSIGFL